MKTNTMKWKKLLLIITFWIAVEIVLNILGIDDLTDCVEYIFTQKNSVVIVWHSMNQSLQNNGTSSVTLS